MNPYFKEGDQLFYSKEVVPQLGHCVLFKKEEKEIVHRYLGEGLIKGDNVKRFDGEIPPIAPLQIIGVITHRSFKGKAHLLSEGLLVRFLTFCSFYNHADNPIFHRIYAMIIKALSRWLRFQENVL